MESYAIPSLPNRRTSTGTMVLNQENLHRSASVAGYYGVPPILVTGDVATCREARKFFGDGVVTVATKQGLAREAAVLYPFEETRKALYEGAKNLLPQFRNVSRILWRHL